MSVILLQRVVFQHPITVHENEELLLDFIDQEYVDVTVINKETQHRNKRMMRYEVFKEPTE